MCLNLNLGIPSVGYDSDMQGCICRLTFTFLSNEIGETTSNVSAYGLS